MHDHWIAERMASIEVSGIRKVFDLGASLTDPVNLSIGQPDFPVPAPIKDAAKRAIDEDKSGYTVTQGILPLREKLLAQVRRRYSGHADRALLVTSGTSGGLVLSLLCTLNPGDEAIIFDPYFVMYPHFIRIAGGTPVFVSTYPSFQIDPDAVKKAITPRTKVIIVNSPANPTAAVCSREVLRDLALLAQKHKILLLSDEVYSAFSFDEPFTSPAEFNPDVLVLDGFSKAYAMTGWRLGYCHGPRRLIEDMTKLQQFTFVCAPSMVQYAGLAALDVDISGIVRDYRRKRDMMVSGLKDHYEIAQGGGAFYLFPKAPWGSGTEFVTEAIKNQLLIIPGNVFSQRDTHFRLSYAAPDAVLQRGIDILRRLAVR
jgi:aspartate aminotransferase/aminotransferase